MTTVIAVAVGLKVIMGMVIGLGLLAALAPRAIGDVSNRGVPGPQDAALELQAAVTKTADFNSAGVTPFGSEYTHPVGQIVTAVVDVTALDTTTGDETYALTLQESDDDVTYVACGVAKSVTAVGVVVVKGIQSKPYLRLALDVGGTTPSITYSAGFAKP